MKQEENGYQSDEKNWQYDFDPTALLMWGVTIKLIDYANLVCRSFYPMELLSE